VARFAGAVLTGGQSRRMGSDKAFVRVHGRPMALIAAAALRDGGAADVVAVGGDKTGLEALGLRWIPDGGEGPLDGLVAALRDGPTDVVVVLACDLPFVTGGAVRTVVDALDAGGAAADAAVPLVDGRPEVLLAAYRRDPVRRAAEAALAAGVRAPREVLPQLEVRWVELADAAWAANANTPQDLPT
jgi:molybdenum cofactor guanylyltransferase